MTQDENNLGYRGASAARTARARAPSLPSTRATRSQVLNHEGWRNGSKQTTLVAILGAAGCGCTDDILEVHSDVAMRQTWLIMVRIHILRPQNGWPNAFYRHTIFLHCQILLIFVKRRPLSNLPKEAVLLAA